MCKFLSIKKAVKLSKTEKTIKVEKAGKTKASKTDKKPENIKTSKTSKKHKFLQVKKLKAPLPFLIFVLAFLALVYVFLPKPELFDLDYSKSFYDKNDQLLKITLSDKDNYRIFTDLNQVNPDYIKAILLYEDKYFYYHLGVNPISLVRSFWQSFVVGGRIYGASTISMQVARMKFDIQSNTIGGKIQQILRAIQVERHYSKKEILTAYINLLPFGGNIYGVEAASRVYFKKSAKNINLLEALNLAIIPQNPNKRAPKFNANASFKNNEFVQTQKQLLQKWQAEYGTNPSLKNFIGLNLAIGSRQTLPNFAPHFINYLLLNEIEKSENATQKNKSEKNNFLNNRIFTSLDLNLQLRLENIVKDYVAKKSQLGIKNAVALVINSKTMGVEALIGSVDFHNDEISGQVDGTAALRSPGSTLKPFAYALALEQGLIHPLSMLEDVPSFYGAYHPMNFDFKYRGLLNATQSLVYSRNLPAVYLANKIKNPDLYEFLQLTEANLTEDAQYYGMGLVLGGVDLTMRKLAELYAVFLNEGFYSKLNYFKNSKPKFLRRVLSEEASFLVLDMLHKNIAPSGISTDDNFYAWKTGTSYAFRDAWSIGVVGDFVVALWLGNFDSSSNQNLIGASMATPLWFRIAKHLSATGKADSQKTQKGNGALKLRQIEICATTGDLPGRYCPKLAKTWIIDGISPLKVENIFRKVRIDKATGLRLCDYELADSESFYEKTYEFWSLDIQNLYKKAGVRIEQPPPYKTGCIDYEQKSDDLKIILPNAKTIIALDLKRGEAKVLFKGMAREAKKLYWFLDDVFIGETKGDEVLEHKITQSGEYKVRMLDDQARSKTTKVRVENLVLSH